MIIASTGAMEPIFVTNINNMRDSSFLPSHQEAIVGIDEVGIHSLTYSLTHSLTHSPTHSPTHLLSYSLTYSLTYLLTHRLSSPLMYCVD